MLRMPELEVLTELDRPVYWFRVTGGGFLIMLCGSELVVDAVGRNDYDSGVTYHVTTDGIFLSLGEPWKPTAKPQPRVARRKGYGHTTCPGSNGP